MMKHNRLQSGGINPVLKTYKEADALLKDPAAWPAGYKGIHVAGFIYQPWREDGGEEVFQVVMVRKRGYDRNE